MKKVNGVKLYYEHIGEFSHELTTEQTAILLKSLCAFMTGEELPKMDEQTQAHYTRIINYQKGEKDNGKR